MALQGNQALTGLWPVGNGKAGTAPQLHTYTVTAGYATAIGEGNIVIRTATGLNLGGAALADGSVMGVAAAPSLASTLDTIQVYDDPDQEFACIVDADITNAATLLSYVGDYIAPQTNTMNTTTLTGNVTLDIASVTGTASTTDCMQIVGVVTSVGDNLSGTNAAGTYSKYAQLRVKFARQTHIFSSQSGTNVTP